MSALNAYLLVYSIVSITYVIFVSQIKENLMQSKYAEANQFYLPQFILL